VVVDLIFNIKLTSITDSFTSKKRWVFMKKMVLLILSLFFVFGFSGLSEAAYVILAPGAYDNGGSNCHPTNEGGIYGSSGGCSFVMPLQIETGKTLSSVTVYYYDNSGSQSISAYLRYVSLSSTGSYSNIASFSDTSTSASIQSNSLAYGSALSSSYLYWLYISLNSDTEITAVKVYYY
jgi:hypothetical protein